MPKVSDQKITKRLIDGLRPDPGGKERFIWDRELKGFGLRVLTAMGDGSNRISSASYVVQYLTPEGRTRRLKLAAVDELAPE